MDDETSCVGRGLFGSYTDTAKADGGKVAVRSVDLDRHMGFSKLSISHAKEIEIKREIEKGQAARTCGRYQNVVLSEKTWQN